jgi:hypothetical protein
MQLLGLGKVALAKFRISQIPSNEINSPKLA